jgi:sugar phosphate isomerase/epimerase
MSDSLSEFARLGLVHHMLYARSVEDPEFHVATLEAMVQRTDIETLDCCLPYGAERQARLVEAIRTSGKEHVAFAIHLFPLRKLSLAATLYAEQAQVRLIVDDMIAQAAAIGATGFVFASGGPPFAEATAAHHRAFHEFCRWLCARLARHNIDALLEPFDFDHDKKFLYGPLDRNLELVARLREEFPNVGIELDMAHLPLMRENFASAIRRTAPWLKRVHLGNCVSRDRADPFYGDKHPPMGYPGGDIDVPQLVEILSTLKETGFLRRGDRGDVLVEINPFPGRSADESVEDNFKRVHAAWQIVISKAATAGAIPAPAKP